MRKPILHLTNWSSRKLHHGRRWTIMTYPRYWERGDGALLRLLPDGQVLSAARHGHISVDEYRELYFKPDDEGLRVERYLKPGVLTACVSEAGAYEDPVVRHGDTLCCACARDAAAQGKCHRVWAGELLRRAGWSIILDGREMAGMDDAGRPVFGEVRRG